MNPFFDQLQDFPRLQGVYQETIELYQPFEQIAAHFAKDKGTVLLLSGALSDASQYDILAIDPWLELTSRQDRVVLSCQGQECCFQQDPFAVLSAIISEFKLDRKIYDLPVHAGLFGYFSYDLKDRIETLPITCVDTNLPDMALFAPSLILIHDKKSEQTFLFIPFFDNENEDGPYVSQKRKQFFERMDQPFHRGPFSIDNKGFESSFTKKEYIDAVNKIIDYLKAGDIYQANLSQRFEAGFTGDTYALFLDLYQRNPAAFFSYINAGDHHIVSTSPERFIHQNGRFVETRPIKGTIARGKDEQQDKKNRQTLCDSVKDDAELTMIVDLMRNDLSRVTQHESVVVREHKRLEPYENVFHLVSVVEGELEQDKTSVDLIKATFPGGSITGCPKIRSMEIIDELESVKRHVYTGSIGYISFHETMDLSIAIRTATIADQRVFFSVGGGIVYDSDPQKEYQETLDKGKTLMDSLSGSQRANENQSIKAWVNGKVIDQDTAVVPVTSPGIQYGAGVFETMKYDAGTIYRLDEHVNRLNRSWEKLFSIPAPDITWKEVIQRLIRENQMDDSSLAIKLMVSKNNEESAHPFFLAGFVRQYIHRLDVLEKSGLDLVTYPHARQTPLADLKTMNYLYYDQAGQYAKDQGADEAIVLNPNQTVSETNTANILFIKGKDVIVPVSDHVLEGVTIQAVLNILSDQGFNIFREPVFIENLPADYSVILTNALMGAVKVLTIDKKSIKQEDGFCSKINNELFN